MTWYIDERADPEKATRAAANYLKTLYGMFGDWHWRSPHITAVPGVCRKRCSGRGSTTSGR
jgi:membrane-bound lytic murein transglycosylase D